MLGYIGNEGITNARPAGAPIYTTSHTQLARLRVRSDHEAWGLFIHLYTPLVKRYVGEVLGQADTHDDVVQEVFLWLYSHEWNLNLPRRGSFRRWLRRVSGNLALKNIERRKRQHQPVDPVMLDDLTGEDIPGSNEIDAADRAQLVERAKTFIRKEFRPQGWEIFRRVYENHEDPLEVARDLGITRNVVHIYGCRIITRLKAVISEFIDEL